MGKKKGGKKKGKEDEEEKPMSAVTALRKQLEEEAQTRWVVLHLNLMNWQHMNSELRVKSDQTLFELKSYLRRRHGSITDLKVVLQFFPFAVRPITLNQ